VVFKDKPEIVGENIVPGGAKPAESTDVKFGIGARSLTEQELALSPQKRGAIVTRVEQDSFAEEIGLQERDIIMAINRTPINSRDDIAKVAQRLKPGDAVAFHVARPQAAAGRARGASAAGSDSLYLSGKLPER